MKRVNSNSTVSKLGESAYNALVMTNQVNGGEKRILHYSYNLTTEAGQEDAYGDVEKKNPLYRSERMIHAHSQEEKHVSEKKRIQRSSSIPLPGRRGASNNKPEKALERSKATERLFYGGVMKGYAETSTKQDVSEAMIAENPEILNNGSRGETHSRKLGLGEKTNTSLMSHKLRKKAVCDSTDNSHYQRQFLRVLNKRF